MLDESACLDGMAVVDEALAARDGEIARLEAALADAQTQGRLLERALLVAQAEHGRALEAAALRHDATLEELRRWQQRLATWQPKPGAGTYLNRRKDMQ
jgi:hypothetical protein